MSHHALIFCATPHPSQPPPVPLCSQHRRLLPLLCITCYCGASIPATNPGYGVGRGDKRRVWAESGRMASGGSGARKWLEQTLGQRLNLAGLASFVRIVATAEGRRLAIPHLQVPDIQWVDWKEMERLGFRGVVFDKDNTLTTPYSLSLWPPISASFARCAAAFPGRIAVFSNSAGLYQYDPDGSRAKELEESVGGVHVIRHETKKPAGSAEDIEKYFGCSASYLIMVGDRCLTDVVFGNRNGFLTILTEPLSLSDEPFIVKQVRKLERCLLSRSCKKGLKPLNHCLLLECRQCIKPPNTESS